MALDDKQEAELKATLETLQKQLKDTQEKAAKDVDEFNKAKLKDESPKKPKVDPDVAKDIAEMKVAIAAIQAKLGASPEEKKTPGFFDDLIKWLNE